MASADDPTLWQYVDVLSVAVAHEAASMRLRAAGAVDADGAVIDPEAAVITAGETSPVPERGGTIAVACDGDAAGWLGTATDIYPGTG